MALSPDVALPDTVRAAARGMLAALESLEIDDLPLPLDLHMTGPKARRIQRAILAARTAGLGDSADPADVERAHLVLAFERIGTVEMTNDAFDIDDDMNCVQLLGWAVGKRVHVTVRVLEDVTTTKKEG